MLIPIALAIGFFSGFAFVFMFLSMDKNITKNISTAIVGVGAPINAILAINKLIIDLTRDEIFQFILWFYISMVITVAIFLFGTDYRLRKDKSIYKLTLLDYFHGDKKTIDIYIQSRKDQMDKLSGLDDIKRENERIIEEQKNLKEENEKLAKRKSSISQKETALDQSKKEFEEMKKEALCLDLPIDVQIPVDMRFIEQTPDFVRKVIDFTNEMKRTTIHLIKKYRDSKDTNIANRETYFIDALVQTGILVTKNFFNEKDVRVHFRYLHETNYYEKLIVVEKGKESTNRIKSIPGGTGIIKAASECKRSVIKSLNPGYHYPGNHDHKWREYITLVFDEFYKDDLPLLTMSISLTNDITYRSLLLFLNYCNIEQIIQTYLIEIHNEIDIFDVIENKIKKSAS